MEKQEICFVFTDQGFLLWLAKINAGKTNNQELLERYQLEAAEALETHFFGKRSLRIDSLVIAYFCDMKKILTLVIALVAINAQAQQADTSYHPHVNLELIKMGNKSLNRFSSQMTGGAVLLIAAQAISLINANSTTPDNRLTKISLGTTLVGSLLVLTAPWHIADASRRFDEAYGINLKAK